MILRLASLLVLMASLYGMVVENNEEFCDDCGNKRWEVINQTSQAPIKVLNRISVLLPVSTFMYVCTGYKHVELIYSIFTMFSKIM